MTLSSALLLTKKMSELPEFQERPDSTQAVRRACAVPWNPIVDTPAIFKAYCIFPSR
jgi:hypothetical protein